MTATGSDWITVNRGFLEEISLVAHSDELVLSYFDGRQPYWSDIVSGRIGVRDVVTAILTDLDSTSVPGIRGRMRVLLGPGGEGKSTALMQLALKLSEKDCTVFWRKPHGSIDPEEIERLPPGRYYFFSDDAEEIVHPLSEIVSRVTRPDFSYVLAARTTSWSASGGLSFPWGSHIGFQKVQLSGVTESDARLLISAWEKLGSRGLQGLAGVPAAERAIRLERVATEMSNAKDGALLGALLKVRYGEFLTAKIRSIMAALVKRRVGDRYTLASALLYIAAAHGQDLPLTPKILAETLNTSASTVVSDVIVPLRDEAVAAIDSSIVATRHQMIAEAVLSIARDLNADVPEMYASLVRSTIRLGRSTHIPGYERFTYLSRRLETSDPAAATIAARAAVDEDPKTLDYASNLVHVLRLAGRADEACDFAEWTARRIHGFTRTSDGKARSFYFDWGAAEGTENRRSTSLWLSALAISDMSSLDPKEPSLRQTEMSLATIGGSLSRLANDQHGDRRLRSAVRAAETLSRELNVSTRAAGFFAAQRRDANTWGIPEMTQAESLDVLLEGMKAAWELREKPIESIPPVPKLAFKGLTSVLGF